MLQYTIRLLRTHLPRISGLCKHFSINLSMSHTHKLPRPTAVVLVVVVLQVVVPRASPRSRFSQLCKNKAAHTVKHVLALETQFFTSVWSLNPCNDVTMICFATNSPASDCCDKITEPFLHKHSARLCSLNSAWPGTNTH